MGDELSETCLHFVKKYGIPSHLMRPLLLYVRERRPLGHFLQAVVSNDLMGAMSRADPLSVSAMKGLTMFVFNEIPGPAWGAQSRYNAWLKEEKEWKVDQFEKWRFEESGVYVDHALTFCITLQRERAYDLWVDGATTVESLRDGLNDELTGDLAVLTAACEILIEEFESGEYSGEEG